MKDRDDQVLRAAKEVAVKYIETGQLPLAMFKDSFSIIYQAVDRAVPRADQAEPPGGGKSGPEAKGSAQRVKGAR